MDEEPMEEFIIIPNIPIQAMEAPTVPKAPSRRCRPTKSRESSASSRPLTESDFAEPAAPSPKIPDDSQNVSKANDSISAEIFQHMESNCFRNTTHVVNDENVILNNSGTSSQLNESMGSLAAGDTPSKPKKMHWKTKQKLENLEKKRLKTKKMHWKTKQMLENLEKKRLKALVNDRLKTPKDKGDAGGSQKVSTDDSLTTSDSTVTEPEDNDNNDSVVVGVSSSASTSSDASGSHSNRSERRPAVPPAQATPPAPAVPLAPLAPAMGYITPEHITVDAAEAEIYTLYSRIDPAFLFLFHGEVKRYITALTNPPGGR